MRSCVLCKGAFLVLLSHRSHRNIFTFFLPSLLVSILFCSCIVHLFIRAHFCMNVIWMIHNPLSPNHCRYWQVFGNVSSELTSKLRITKLNYRLSFMKVFIKVFIENFSSQLCVFLASNFRVHFQLEQSVVWIVQKWGQKCFEVMKSCYLCSLHDISIRINRDTVTVEVWVL